MKKGLNHNTEFDSDPFDETCMSLTSTTSCFPLADVSNNEDTCCFCSFDSFLEPSTAWGFLWPVLFFILFHWQKWIIMLTLAVFVFLTVCYNYLMTGDFCALLYEWLVCPAHCYLTVSGKDLFLHVFVIRKYGRSGSCAFVAIVFNNVFNLLTPIG